MKRTLYTTIFLLLAVGAIAGTEYVYDHLVLDLNIVSGVGTPTGMNDGLTDGYANVVATLSCINITNNNTLCDDGVYTNCHPNKPTADRLCELAGYGYASSYVIDGGVGPMGAYANAWTGRDWAGGDGTDIGYGGGGYDPTYHAGANFLQIKTITCCS